MSGNTQAAANAANLMQFNPLYLYQVQMAHQALQGKKPCKCMQNEKTNIKPIQ